MRELAKIPPTNRPPPSHCARILVTTDAEPQSSAKINSQRRITDNFVVVLVQQILTANVCTNARCDRVPSSGVYEHVGGSVINVETVEVRISAMADKVAFEVGPPMRPEIGRQQSRRVLWPPKQRPPRPEDWIERQWRFEDLACVVGIGRI